MTKMQMLEKQNKDLRIQLSNEKAKRELAELSHQAELDSLRSSMGEMPGQITLLQKSLVKCDEIIARLKEEITSLKKEKLKLTECYEKAKGVIDKLKARLRKDSSTSDKPPSTDAYKKPKPQSLREKSGKKPGGQRGHAGHTLSLFPNPTRIVDITLNPEENYNYTGS